MSNSLFETETVPDVDLDTWNGEGGAHGYDFFDFAADLGWRALVARALLCGVASYFLKRGSGEQLLLQRQAVRDFQRLATNAWCRPAGASRKGGTSYQALVSDVRREGTLAISETAFHRAFKRWAGEGDRERAPWEPHPAQLPKLAARRGGAS